MNLEGLFILIAAIMFGPPLVLVIVGFATRKNQPKVAKVFFILAAVYVLAGGGICATILTA